MTCICMSKISKFAFLRSLDHCVVNLLVNSADQCARRVHILRVPKPAFVVGITRATEN